VETGRDIADIAGEIDLGIARTVEALEVFKDQIAPLFPGVGTGIIRSLAATGSENGDFLVAHQLLEQPELVPLINELYRTWGHLHNIFHPNLELLSKIRKGSKTLRKYRPPQTPYQRLLQSEHLSPEQKQELQSQFQQFNPLRLKEQIEQKFKRVFDEAQNR